MHVPTHSLLGSDLQKTGKQGAAAPSLGLLNTYSSRNLGDAAIISAISQLSGAADVRANISDASPVRIPGLTYQSDLVSCNRYVSVGGDIFNNARPLLLTRNFVANVRQLHARADRTIVFGQTIPSSCGWLGLPLLTAALARTKAVIVRDRESFQLLRKFGVAVTLSHDAAFALRPSDRGIWSADHLLAKQGLSAEKTVLLSVRSFDSIYRQDEEKFQRDMADLARRLLDRGHQVAVMIQSDVNERDSDRIVAAKLQAAEPRLKIVDFLDGSGSGNPVDTILGALTIVRSVVAVRYHAAVLRMAGGRQPYHLFYSRKGRDLHQRHGLSGTALENFDPAKAVVEIEKLAEQQFASDALRRDVQGAFTRAYGKLA